MSRWGRRNLIQLGLAEMRNQVAGPSDEQRLVSGDVYVSLDHYNLFVAFRISMTGIHRYYCQNSYCLVPCPRNIISLAQRR